MRLKNRRKKRRLSSRVKPAESRILLSGTSPDTSANEGSLSLTSGGFNFGHNALNHGEKDISISAWFNTSDRNALQSIITNGYSRSGEQQYWLGLVNGKLWFNSRLSGSNYHVMERPQQIENGQWYHAAVTMDRDGLATMYLDGNIVDTVDISSMENIDFKNLSGGYGALTIGRRYSATPTEVFQGKLDDVRIFERVLDQSQIDHLGEYDNSLASMGSREVAHWKFDDATNLGLDEMGQLNGVALAGSSYSVDVEPLITPSANAGSSLLSTSGLNLGHDALNHGYEDISLSAWFKTSDRNALQSIITNGYSLSGEQQHWLGIYNGKLWFNSRPTGANYHVLQSTELIENDRWYHVVVTMDRDALATLYLDGETIDTVDISDMANVDFKNLAGGYGALTIGQRYGATPTQVFQGNLDDVRIYQNALTEWDVLHLYNYADSLSLFGISEVAHWRFDDAANLGLDETGNFSSTMGSGATFAPEAPLLGWTVTSLQQTPPPPPDPNSGGIPAVQSARRAVRRTHNSNNLQGTMLGVINFDGAYGNLPANRFHFPGSTYEYGWRVAILPFVEEYALFELINQFELYGIGFATREDLHQFLDETMPDIFLDYQQETNLGETTFQAVIGDNPKAAFTDQLSSTGYVASDRSISDITDGPIKTIAVVRTDSAFASKWYEPDSAINLDNQNPAVDEFWFNAVAGETPHECKELLLGYLDGHVDFTDIDSSIATPEGVLPHFTARGGEYFEEYAGFGCSEPEEEEFSLSTWSRKLDGARTSNSQLFVVGGDSDYDGKLDNFDFDGGFNAEHQIDSNHKNQFLELDVNLDALDTSLDLTDATITFNFNEAALDIAGVLAGDRSNPQLRIWNAPWYDDRTSPGNLISSDTEYRLDEFGIPNNRSFTFFVEGAFLSDVTDTATITAEVSVADPFAGNNGFRKFVAKTKADAKNYAISGASEKIHERAWLGRVGTAYLAKYGMGDILLQAFIKTGGEFVVGNFGAGSGLEVSDDDTFFFGGFRNWGVALGAHENAIIYLDIGKLQENGEAWGVLQYRNLLFQAAGTDTGDNATNMTKYLEAVANANDGQQHRWLQRQLDENAFKIHAIKNWGDQISDAAEQFAAAAELVISFTDAGDLAITAMVLTDPDVPATEKIITAALGLTPFVPAALGKHLVRVTNAGFDLIKSAIHYDEVASFFWKKVDGAWQMLRKQDYGDTYQAGLDTLENVDSVAWNLAAEAGEEVTEWGLDKWCFTGETLVHTCRGPVRFDEVTKGDQVRAFDFSTGEWICRAISRFHKNEYSGILYKFTTESGSEVEVTRSHPFWIVDGEDLTSRPEAADLQPHENEGDALSGRWVDSEFVRVGDTIQTVDGKTEKITIRTERMVDSVWVFNFTVSKHPSYAVGMSGILVHNSWCDVLVKGIKGAQGISTAAAEQLLATQRAAVAAAWAGVQAVTSLTHGHHMVWRKAAAYWNQTRGKVNALSQEILLVSGVDRLVDEAAAATRAAAGETLHNLSIAPQKYVHGEDYARSVLGYLRSQGDELLTRAIDAARQEAASFGKNVNMKSYYDMTSTEIQRVQDAVAAALTPQEMTALRTNIQDGLGTVRVWLANAQVNAASGAADYLERYKLTGIVSSLRHSH